MGTVLPRQIKATRNKTGAIDANRLISDPILKLPLGSYISRELTILDTSIEIRNRVEAAPFIWDTNIQLPWNPKAATSVSRLKVNIRCINLKAVPVLTMKYILFRRHPDVSSVALGDCDYGVGIDHDVKPQ
jgi:hypothetical protein